MTRLRGAALALAALGAAAPEEARAWVPSALSFLQSRATTKVGLRGGGLTQAQRAQIQSLESNNGKDVKAAETVDPFSVPIKYLTALCPARRKLFYLRLPDFFETASQSPAQLLAANNARVNSGANSSGSPSVLLDSLQDPSAMAAFPSDPHRRFFVADRATKQILMFRMISDGSLAGATGVEARQSSSVTPSDTMKDNGTLRLQFLASIVENVETSWMTVDPHGYLFYIAGTGQDNGIVRVDIAELGKMTGLPGKSHQPGRVRMGLMYSAKLNNNSVSAARSLTTDGMFLYWANTQSGRSNGSSIRAPTMKHSSSSATVNPAYAATTAPFKMTSDLDNVNAVCLAGDSYYYADASNGNLYVTRKSTGGTISVPPPIESVVADTTATAPATPATPTTTATDGPAAAFLQRDHAPALLQQHQDKSSDPDLDFQFNGQHIDLDGNRPDFARGELSLLQLNAKTAVKRARTASDAAAARKTKKDRAHVSAHDKAIAKQKAEHLAHARRNHIRHKIRSTTVVSRQQGAVDEFIHKSMQPVKPRLPVVPAAAKTALLQTRAQTRSAARMKATVGAQLTNRRTVTTTKFQKPESIVYDGDATLYVADSQQNAVFSLPANYPFESNRAGPDSAGTQAQIIKILDLEGVQQLGVWSGARRRLPFMLTVSLLSALAALLISSTTLL